MPKPPSGGDGPSLFGANSAPIIQGLKIRVFFDATKEEKEQVKMPRALKEIQENIHDKEVLLNIQKEPYGLQNKKTKQKRTKSHKG